MDFIAKEYFKSILTSFEGDDPIGKDVSDSEIYFQLEEAYKCDTDTENRGVWVRKFKTTDWDSVEKISIQILSEQSKDLYVLSLLMDFIYVRKGFGAFLESIECFENFIENFSDKFYPLQKEKRLNLLDWFFKNINKRLREMQKTEVDPKIFEYADKNISIINNFENFLKNREMLTSQCEIFLKTVNQLASKYVRETKPEIKMEIGLVSDIENKEENNITVESAQELNLDYKKFTVEDAYQQIEAIKNFLETHEPRKVTYLILDLVKELKDYTIKDLIQNANNDASPMFLLSKLICKEEGKEEGKKVNENQ